VEVAVEHGDPGLEVGERVGVPPLAVDGRVGVQLRDLAPDDRDDIGLRQRASGYLGPLVAPVDDTSLAVEREWDGR